VAHARAVGLRPAAPARPGASASTPHTPPPLACLPASRMPEPSAFGRRLPPGPVPAPPPLHPSHHSAPRVCAGVAHARAVGLRWAVPAGPGDIASTPHTPPPLACVPAWRMPAPSAFGRRLLPGRVPALRRRIPRYPQTPLPSDPATLRPRYPQTPLPSDPATLRPRYPQTPLPSDPATLRPRHPQTPPPSPLGLARVCGGTRHGRRTSPRAACSRGVGRKRFGGGEMSVRA